MSKICLATYFSDQHEFDPGTAADARRMEANLWEVCGQPRGHFRHRGACAEGCGRVAAKGSAGGYCCKRCVQHGDHTDKCDEREGRRDAD